MGSRHQNLRLELRTKKAALKGRLLDSRSDRFSISSLLYDSIVEFLDREGIFDKLKMKPVSAVLSYLFVANHGKS